VGWALETPTGSVSRKAVLIALANATNHHTGLCCPSLKRLAAEADLSVSTVQRAIDALIEMGLVAKSERQRENGSKTSNVYTFPTTPYGHGDHTPLVTVTTPEPELRTRKEPLAAAPRKRNLIWDALTYVFGEPTTKTATQVRGKVCASLTAAGATPDQVVARASAWPAHFDSAVMTDLALEKHWDTLARRPLRRR
jgi:DNA-binding transcriptional MocR family regulator